MNRLAMFSMWLVAASVSPAFASGYNRPVPQAQPATVELWFALASLCLCIALYVVHRVVKRR